MALLSELEAITGALKKPNAIAFMTDDAHTNSDATQPTMCDFGWRSAQKTTVPV